MKTIYGPEFSLHGTVAQCVENASADFVIVIANAGETRYRNSHRGWYLDETCDEVVYGSVLQKRADYEADVASYIAAICSPSNDNAYFIEAVTRYNDSEEARRAADSMAETYAEYEREYNARATQRANAEFDIDSCRERIRDIRKRHSYLVTRIMTGAGDDAAGARMRQELRGSISAIRDRLAAAREELAQNPHETCY